MSTHGNIYSDMALTPIFAEKYLAIFLCCCVAVMCLKRWVTRKIAEDRVEQAKLTCVIAEIEECNEIERHARARTVRAQERIQYYQRETAHYNCKAQVIREQTVVIKSLRKPVQNRLRNKLEQKLSSKVPAHCGESFMEKDGIREAERLAEAAAAALLADDQADKLKQEMKKAAKASKKSRAKVNKSEETTFEECIFCMDAPSCVMLYPCKHCLLCKMCAKALLAVKMECPTCRGRVDSFTGM